MAGAPTPPFEATCPRCGMTAPVGAGTRQARCGRCGTAIRLADLPVVQRQPRAAGPEAAGQPDRTGIGLAIGLGAPIMVTLAFLAGHNALDSPDPDTGAAATWYIAAVVLAAAAAFAPWPVLGPRANRLASWGLLAACALPALWFGTIVSTAYADESAFAVLFFVFFVLPLAGAYYIGLVIYLFVQASRGTLARAVPFTLASGAGIAAGLGLASALVLADLDGHAERAREAHRDSPAAAAALLALLLPALAALRRRRA